MLGLYSSAYGASLNRYHGNAVRFGVAAPKDDNRQLSGVGAPYDARPTTLGHLNQYLLLPVNVQVDVTKFWKGKATDPFNDRSDWLMVLPYGLSLKGRSIRNFHMPKVFFNKTDLENTRLSDGNMSGVTLPELGEGSGDVQWEQIEPTLARGSTMLEVNAKNAYFQNVAMQNMDFIDVDFTNATLSGIDFTGSRFVNCTMDKAKLIGSNLTNVEMVGGSYDEMDVNKAVMDYIDLEDTDWTKVKNFNDVASANGARYVPGGTFSFPKGSDWRYFPNTAFEKLNRKPRKR